MSKFFKNTQVDFNDLFKSDGNNQSQIGDSGSVLNSFKTLVDRPKFDDDRKKAKNGSRLAFLKKLVMLGKRQRIIIATLLLMFGFLVVTQEVNVIFRRYHFILGIGVLAYILSVWAIWEGLSKTKLLVLFILPTMFALAATGFYFLLPIRWLTRVPATLLFGFCCYCLLLSQNVFNVASNRTIPLYRAASTVSFIFVLITAFFLFNVTLSFQLPFYLNALAIFAITFPLNLQALWAIKMENISGSILAYSIILALQFAEIALCLSFWPVEPTIWSLFLTASVYILLGVMLDLLRERLSRRQVMEYAGIGILVIIIGVLGTSWVG